MSGPRPRGMSTPPTLVGILVVMGASVFVGTVGGTLGALLAYAILHSLR